jgi:glycosyltransferase involved in cell wall biosynthesis
LSKRILLTGKVSNVSDYLTKSQIFCLTSRTEAFPNALGEAMSYGLLCITTDVGDCRILLNNDEWIIENENREMLIEKLENAIELSDIERTTLGMSNYDRIVGHFSIEQVTDRFNRYCGLSVIGTTQQSN